MPGRFADLCRDDEAGARALLIAAVVRAEGNLSRAAKLLGTTYVVATRLARRLGAWGEIDRIRRAAARKRMVVPELFRPDHAGHRGSVKPHWRRAEEVWRSGGRVR